MYNQFLTKIIYLFSARLEQNSNDSQASGNEETILKINELSSPETVDSSSTSTKENVTNFEKSGVFITDHDITLDIATSTGLRKTGFGSNLYDESSPKKPISKIPRSPMSVRRKSIDNSNVDSENVTGLPMNRKAPVYRSVRKLTPNDGSNGKISTWSGRTGTAKPRTALTANTFKQQSPQPMPSSSFSRNPSIRGSQILYDQNGRKIKSGTSSLTTSPIKKSASASPLAKQILEVAGTAKTDSQILEKMKELLNKYTSKSSSKQNIRSPDYEDFTTAWVNSNGALDRVGSVTPKDYSKRSSTISSETESLNSKDLSVVSPLPRRETSGSKIPAPMRRNTEIY